MVTSWKCGVLQLETKNQAYEENVSLLMEAKGEVSHLKAGLACVEEQVAHTQLEIERIRVSRQREIEEAMSEVVKQYRLSRDYFRRKYSYTSCFSKFSSTPVVTY